MQAIVTTTSTSVTHPDGSVTVTLTAGITNEDWMTEVVAIQDRYPKRYAQWLLDAEGRDVFEIGAAK
jgi:hypothetical protein